MTSTGVHRRVPSADLLTGRRGSSTFIRPLPLKPLEDFDTSTTKFGDFGIMHLLRCSLSCVLNCGLR
jgi:hypothetical protein